MRKNMGTFDRGLRLIVAIALAIAAFSAPIAMHGAIHWLALLVAVVLAGTAVLGNCPIYAMLGIRTCRNG